MTRATRIPSFPLLIAAGLALPASPSIAQVLGEERRLEVADATPNDFFASSVAATDLLVAVGALSSDGVAPQAGAVYLFDPADGSVLRKIVAADGTSRDEFGAAVAIEGTTLVVGAPFDDDIDFNAGAAYVLDATTGAQLWKFTAASGQSLTGSATAGEEFAGFGQSVAIDAGRVLAGAPYTFLNDNPTGAAYLFEIEAGALLARLVPPDAGAIGYGSRVALAGDRAVVTAPFDEAPGYGRGSAFIHDAATGEVLHTLLPDMPGGSFGDALAVAGDLVVIGAPSQPIGGEHLYGAAYLFDLRTGKRIHTLLPDDADGRGFGRSVAIADGLVVVGAWDAVEGGVFTAGAAYAFDPATGVQVAKLVPSDGAPDRAFGWAAAAGGGRAIVGAYRDTTDGFSGAAYVFALDTAAACEADLDGDGRVDAVDLGAVLDAWGPCKAGCAADIDGDGRVDATDLSVVLGGWGDCH